MPHTVTDRTIVKTLVGSKLRAELITYTHQQESTLSAVDRDLPNELIEALLEETLTDRADTDVAGLTSY